MNKITIKEHHKNPCGCSWGCVGNALNAKSWVNTCPTHERCKGGITMKKTELPCGCYKEEQEGAPTQYMFCEEHKATIPLVKTIIQKLQQEAKP